MRCSGSCTRSSPAGRYAERAAWKVGWLAYRNDQLRRHRARISRAPPRGSRARTTDRRGSTGRAVPTTRCNEPGLAQARYTLAATDYLNSYYGRLAARRGWTRAGTASVADAGREAWRAAPRPAPAPAAERARDPRPAGPRPLRPGDRRAALRAEGLGRFPGDRGDAAWVFQQQGQSETGERQFALYRSAINTMKRAYPQFWPRAARPCRRSCCSVIFPLGYWDLIRKYAARARSGSVLGRGARGAGIDLRRDIQSYGEGRRA